MSTLPIGSAMADPPKANLQQQPKFTELNDLTGEKVGGKVLFATDDWFATAENLLKTEAPVWKEGVFTEYGKWMDGWETRRKRIEGYDWCIIQLGVPGVIHGVDVDTSFFTGNYAPRCSIQAACLEKNFPGREEKMGSAASEEDFKEIDKLDSENWEHIVSLSSLQPGYKTSCHNFFQCDTDKRFTHIRLNMYPDGGIARLRVYGKAAPDWSQVTTSELIDLIAMENGGMCIGYTDAHFGHPRNLIQPGRAETMADGWETARKLIDLIAMENGGMCIGYTDAHFGHPRNLIQLGRAETMADGWETARKVSFFKIYNMNIDLITMENGGMCIGYTYAHFGHSRNLIQPDRAETMADGWETARKVTRPAILQANKDGILQVPGTDWCVFRLGHQGIIKKIEIDTNHFKGNFPDSCRIEGCCISEDREPEGVKNLSGDPWRTLLPVTKLSAHNRLFLEGSSIKNGGVISHVRLTMAPDGGISRLRLWGHKQITEISKF